MNFRITGLPPQTFAHLFDLSDEALQARGAVRQIAEGAEPCRISLTDAPAGEEVILVNYEHHPVASPYRGRYAVFVRRGETRFDAVGDVPEQLRRRMLAARAFDAAGMAVAVELVAGADLEPIIGRFFADERTAYIHLHYAAAGCYAALVERAA